MDINENGLKFYGQLKQTNSKKKNRSTYILMTTNNDVMLIDAFTRK